MMGVVNAFVMLIRSEASFNKLVWIFDVLPFLSSPSPEYVGHVDERLDIFRIDPALRLWLALQARFVEEIL